MIAVEMRNITKQFGSLKANDGVALSVVEGEIHALVGENGAGKSTLMNILYGMYRPDAGQVLIHGQEHAIETASKAISLGLGMVHQHFMLIPPFTAAENIILGKEPAKSLGRIDYQGAQEDLRKLSETFRLTVDLSAKVESFSVGQQQRVEILKILYRHANILILDEPTAVLTPQEVDELFETLRNLKKQGKTVILIAHKLSEVMAISDRVTVMRKGKVVGQLDTATTTQMDIARLMVGRDIEFHLSAQSLPGTEPILEVRGLSALNDRHVEALRSISVEVHAREVLGIAAVEGNGQLELVQCVTGQRTPTSGSVRLHGVEISRTSHQRHVAHIPEDRIKSGIVLSLSIPENLILGRQSESEFSNPVSLHRSHIHHYAEVKMAEFDIRASSSRQQIGRLSGGNQQKVVIARELSKDARLLVANHPTRGLDIGAIEFVHKALIGEREKGKGILLVSADLTELLTLSDRIVVMFQGEIVAMFGARETSERELGAYMTGAQRKAG